MSSNSASVLGAPIVASIRRTSAAVCGMNGIGSGSASVRLGGQLRFVAARVEHRGELLLVVRADAHDPAGAVGILVDQLGTTAEIRIAGDDLAADGAVDIGRGLD